LAVVRLLYRLLKTSAAALVPVLLNLCASHADEPDLEALLGIAGNALPFRDAWQRCTTTIVKRELESKLAAEQSPIVP
jgi:hypothetical protein